ncbi:C6 zink-finger PRO1A [Fusarium phyllophilum]|uniref:C6 zink-finger PRO1A n=1 Tax=Fusarium phyllophilum TaxID=47803 RepID=A0A8H5IPW0_9HYPO|nr:C6 zink-finger PRO1A [Fusarium phyllophilum]
MLLTSSENATSGTTPSPILTPRSLQSRVLSGRSFAEPLHYDEASLLMHYLDHRLAAMAPKQKWPSLPCIHGPRGIASAIITRRGKQPSSRTRVPYQSGQTVVGLVSSIGTNELRPENETLVEIITDVLRGSATNWQPHLNAMSSIAVMMHNQPQLAQSVYQLPTPLFEGKATAAMAFHLPVLLWMDLLACVATREAPRLPYDKWLEPNCTFQLAHIMGCRNSVMKSIGDLAVLSQWKSDCLKRGSLDPKTFQTKRQHIEDELENVMDATSMAAMESQRLSSSHKKPEQRPEQDCVTRIFAAAALAQLAALTTQVLKSISTTIARRGVSRVILEIKVASQIVSPRQLSWPICVAGCLADRDQQPFFEALLGSVLSEETGMIGNCGTVRDILRACWSNKAEQPDHQWDCSSTMKQLGVYALLI